MIDEEEDCHEEFVYKKILSKRKRVFLFKRKSNARGHRTLFGDGEGSGYIRALAEQCLVANEKSSLS